METIIAIEGLQLWGTHGVLAQERVRPQAFEIDVTLKLPKVEADDLTQTVDYDQVIETIHRLNQTHHFQLVEAFAGAIARRLLTQFERAEEATVRVRKRPALAVGVHLRCVWAQVQVKRGRAFEPFSA